MTDIRLATLGGWVIPSNRLTTVSANDTLAIAASPTVTTLLTLPQIEAAQNPVIIVATVELSAPGASAALGNILFRLFRDGVEISATDTFRFSLIDSGGFFSGTAHWVDTAAGQAPIYSIRAERNAAFTINALNRRATARS